jgi:hypothetical protein
LPFHRFYLRLQLGKIEPTDKGPPDPRRMGVINQVVDPTGAKVFTLAVRTP